MFEDMKSRGLRPNRSVYNALLMVLGPTGQTALSFQYFEEMQAKGIAGDIVTYNSLIGVCKTVGDWQKALQVRDPGVCVCVCVCAWVGPQHQSLVVYCVSFASCLLRVCVCLG